MVTDLVADARAHACWRPARCDRWAFAANAIAAGLAALPPAAVLGIVHAAWWAHAVILLGFLMFLPYSKHLHILAAPLNVFFAPTRPEGPLLARRISRPRRPSVSGRSPTSPGRSSSTSTTAPSAAAAPPRCPANMSGKELDPKMAHPAPAGAPAGERAQAPALPRGDRRRPPPRATATPKAPWWATSSTTTCCGPAPPAAGAWTPARSSSSTCRRSWTCAAGWC